MVVGIIRDRLGEVRREVRRQRLQGAATAFASTPASFACAG